MIMDTYQIISLVVLLVFYIAIFSVGIVASRWYRRKKKQSLTLVASEDNIALSDINGPEIGSKDESATTSSSSTAGLLDLEADAVANRSLGSVVGWLTMSATVVGGGFLNGTAESVNRDGLLWTLAPIGITFGLIIGGLIFAPIMRRGKYVTLLDPLDIKFGKLPTVLVTLTCLLGDVLWSGSILAALGTSLNVISGLNIILSIILSAVIAVGYTLFGQIISVVSTDIIQLALLTIGLVVSIPFVLTNDLIEPKMTPDIMLTNATWVGHIPTESIAAWIDLLIAMTLGTIPWTSYFQRVLSMKSESAARNLSIFAGLSAAVLSVPPVLIGVVAHAADWNMTTAPTELVDNKSLTLPLVIRYFTPSPVAVLGLCAISAAVMSSTDSAILGSASLFTYRVYREIRCGKAGVRETKWCIRITILILGVVSTLIALLAPSNTIYGLFIIAADLVFVSTLPQLIAALFIPIANGYGSIAGFVISLLLRLLSGDPILNITPLLHWPYYNDTAGQLFPFRTFTMLLTLITITLISLMARAISKYSNCKITVINASIS